MQVSDLAERLGLPDQPSLAEIVEKAAPRGATSWPSTAPPCARPPSRSTSCSTANRGLLEAAYLASAASVATAEGSLTEHGRATIGAKRTERRPTSLDDTRSPSSGTKSCVAGRTRDERARLADVPREFCASRSRRWKSACGKERAVSPGSGGGEVGERLGGRDLVEPALP